MSQIEILRKYLPSRIGEGLGYTGLSADDLSEADTRETSKDRLWPHERKSSFWFWTTMTLLGFIVFCILVFTILGLVYATRFNQGAHKTIIYSSGRSLTEARAKGCHFEPMMSAWIPDQCSYPDLVEEYEDIFETWRWYSDGNLTTEITGVAQLNELRTGNYSGIWTSHKHAHDLHCLYVWRKISITIEKNLPLLDARSLIWIVRSRIGIVERRFKGDIQFNGNAFIYRNDTVEDQYVGNPTNNIDKAWESLLSGNTLGFNIDLMYAELIHSSEKTYKWKDDNFFLSGVSVYHSLYCLNKVREALYPDYYQAVFSLQGPSRETYIEYCIDHLRQAIQCHSDLTPMNWERIGGNLTLKSDTIHTCRDFKKVHEWASQRTTDYASKTELGNEGVRIVV